ncbi:MAG: BPTD_3080 family restriction endonuclease [Pseudomonadota bacterium]
MTAPRSLIINTPYDPPAQHWQPASHGTLTLVPQRRAAGYEIFDVRNNTKRVETLDLVNRIRERVDAWRADDCPGITSVTRRLLENWRDLTAREYPFYFCQLEAIETLIWWVEAPDAYRQGIQVPGDGGPWERLCSKMATGAGKTTVMAMVVTWQVLNALTFPRRNRDFSRGILIVTPGLTVKERLRVLYPGEPDNYYDAFRLCPSESLRQKLNQAEILIENWHSLMPLKPAERSVVKKGAESDEAYTRRVLGKLAGLKDLVVINDEAHHAYRIPPEAQLKKSEHFDPEEATRWVEGLDRIHRTRRIQRCFDLSATPFIPSGKANAEVGLFDWIVSDFGLNDAIEAGLVKTPRVVVRDDAMPDAATLRSKLYHLYRDDAVAEDVNRRGAQPHEPLPRLVQDAYTLLGADWRATWQQWRDGGHVAPPVMLTVCNRTETAARIEHYFNKGDAHWSELHAPERTLRVDSRVLEKAELGETAASDREYEARLQEILGAARIPEDRKARARELRKEELLRTIVDNVGKAGTPGQDVQNVVSVAMLSEGWDAKNVTHIMGLRAFTSQLLCEQVIGRGLRRVTHDFDEHGRYRPEYVNVFGVPLSIFLDAGPGGDAPAPPKASMQIESLPERNALEIRWPNVLRIDSVVRPTLTVDWSRVDALTLDPSETRITAEVAPAVGGATDLGKVHVIDLERLPEEFRLQRLVFKAARKAFDSLAGGFNGSREYLVLQLVRLVEEFLRSDRLQIPSLFHQDPLRRRILLSLNVDAIVQHLVRFVEEQNLEQLEPVFDGEDPIGSTRAMRTWYTTKPNVATTKSQISHVVGDSTWEIFAAQTFERSSRVVTYAKNDHLGFVVYYLWNGVRRRYLPDFLVRLADGSTLVLEIKGDNTDQDCAKRAALAQWVAAVNAKGGFGTWRQAVAFDPNDVRDIVEGMAPAVA